MKNTEKQLYYIPFNDFNNEWYKEYQGKIVDRIIPYCALIKITDSNKDLYLSSNKKEK